MMLSGISERCKAVLKLVKRSTDAAKALSIELQSRDPSQQRDQPDSLGNLHLDLVKGTGNLTSEHLQTLTKIVENSQHEKFITQFTSLVSVLTPLLAKLEPAPDFSASHTFWKLWDLLLYSCKFFNMWPQVRLHGTPESNASLHTALDTLTTWLLPFTRKLDGAWASARVGDAAGGQTEQARCILTVILHCFVSITSQPSQHGGQALDFIYDLPPDFVAKACCLVCEQLSNTLPNVVDAKVKRSAAHSFSPAGASNSRETAAVPVAAAAAATADLTRIFFADFTCCILVFVDLDIMEGSQSMLQFLAVPCVMQLLKTTIAHFPETFVTEKAKDECSCTIKILAMMVRYTQGYEDGLLVALASQSSVHTKPDRSTRRKIWTDAMEARGECPGGLEHNKTLRIITSDADVYRSVGRHLEIDSACRLLYSMRIWEAECFNKEALVYLRYARGHMQHVKDTAMSHAQASVALLPRLCINSMDLQAAKELDLQAEDKLGAQAEATAWIWEFLLIVRRLARETAEKDSRPPGECACVKRAV